MYHSGDTGNSIRDTEIQDTGYTIKDAGCRKQTKNDFGYLFLKKNFFDGWNIFF